MATAFELAVEISYYAGKLWDIATNPDIARGDTRSCNAMNQTHRRFEFRDKVLGEQLMARGIQAFLEARLVR